MASTLETDVLPARVRHYSPADLDALISGGDLVWMGAGALGPNDGRVRLFWRDEIAMLAPPSSSPSRPPPSPPSELDTADGDASIPDPISQALLNHPLPTGGGVLARPVRGRSCGAARCCR